MEVTSRKFQINKAFLLEFKRIVSRGSREMLTTQVSNQSCSYRTQNHHRKITKNSERSKWTPAISDTKR